MLRRIELRNFKAFEHLGPLELKPLTVFCGPNAAGKSSAIQSLLLLKQTALEHAQHQDEDLVTSGDTVVLGDYADVVFGHDLDRNVSIELSADDLDLFETERVVVTTGFEFRTFQVGELRRGWRGWSSASALAAPSLSRFAISMNGAQSGRRVFQLEYKVDDNGGYPNVTGGDGLMRVIVGEGTGMRTMNLVGNMVNFAGLQLQPGGTLGPDGNASELAEVAIVDQWCEPSEFEDEPTVDNLVGLLRCALDVVTAEFIHLDYVGPAREAPQRYYQEPGTRGKSRQRPGPYAVRRDRISAAPMPPGARQMDGNAMGGGIDDAVSAWLEYLGLPDVQVALEGRDYRYLVQSPYSRDCRVTLADTGYGVSQVLPILVRGLDGYWSPLILDQPELHLHPRVQTGIADFALAVSRDRPLIVETHSDHFVNRIVRRVVEGSASAEDVAVYFFTPTADGPHVEEVQIDPTFGIRNWPLGFFDQYADEQEAIIRASLERRSREERN